MKPLLSIVVAAFNVEQYIAQCLDSLIRHEIKEIEIIVIDDGSSDKTFDIIKAYADLDNRVKVYSKPNGGLGSARNYGIEKSTGYYIGFLDGDDYVDLRMYSFLLDRARAYDADIVSCVHTCFYDGDESPAYIYPKYPFEAQEFFFPKNDNQKHRAILNYSVCNKIFKRHLILRFYENLLHEDVPFVFRLYLSKVSVLVTSAPLHYYRQGRVGQLTRRDDKSRFDLFKIDTVLKGLLLESHASYEWYSFYFFWKISFFNTVYNRLSPRFKAEYFNCASRSFRSDINGFFFQLKCLKGRRLRFCLFYFGLRSLYSGLCCIDSIFFALKRHLFS